MFSRTPLLTLACSLSILLPAIAQDTTPAKPAVPAKDKDKDKDKDVIISASRLEEAPKDVAASNTVVTSTDILRGQQRMVIDALREVPALDIVSNGGLGKQTSVFMRGAGSDETLVMIDGVEANNPIATGRGFDFANLTTDNIERIEIIRGPQSVLYGSDAMGGVINIITKRGQGETHGNVMLEAGSFATYRGSVGVSGGTDKVNYSFAASRVQSTGISTADEDMGNHEKDGYRNDSFSGRVGWTPVTWFDLDITARGSDAHSEIDSFGGVGGDDPNRTTDTAQWLFQIAPRLRLFDNFWETTLAFSLTNLESHDDNPPDAETFGSFNFGAFSSELITLDWQNTFTVAAGHTLIVGATFREERGNSSNLFQNFAPPPDVLVDVFDEDAWIRSGYAQYRAQLFDRLTVSGGARLDSHEEFGTHATYRGTAAYYLDRTETKFRGTAGTGFKTPSLFQLFSSFGDPNLKPEECFGWDVGVDQNLFDGKMTASLTYFRTDFTNLIDFDSATSTYNNIGRVKTAGVEAAVRIFLLKELELRLSYTFTDAEDKATGDQLLRRPRHKGGIRALYSPVEAVRLNASVLYVGNRSDLDFSTFPGTPVTLDDYILVDLAASWQIDPHVDLFIRGQNVADQEYTEAFGFGVPGAAVYVGANIGF